MERWRKFENDVHDYLREQAKERALIVHRFYDSKSAGDMLPAQPGDFLVIYQAMPILLELKSSEVFDSLRSCFSSHVSSAQIAFHRLWRRAGAQTWFLFLGADGRFERWPLFPCQLARETGKPLKNGRQRTFGALSKTIESVLEDHLPL